MFRPHFYFDEGAAGGGDSPQTEPPSTPPTTPPSSDPPPTGLAPGPVPYNRFSEVVEEKNKAEKELAAFQAAEKKRQEDALKEQNKWKELAEQRERDLENERLNNTRLQVAAEKNLPPALAGRLQGSTREEMIADADLLLQSVKQTGPGAPPPGGGHRPKPPDLGEMSVEEIMKLELKAGNKK